MSLLRLSFVGFALAAGLLSTNAYSLVVDVEDLPLGSTCFQDNVPVESGGAVISPGPGGGSLIFCSPSAVLLPFTARNGTNVLYGFTEVFIALADGGLFSVVGVDLGEADFDVTTFHRNILVVSGIIDGQEPDVMRQAVSLDGSFGFQTVELAGPSRARSRWLSHQNDH